MNTLWNRVRLKQSFQQHTLSSLFREVKLARDLCGQLTVNSIGVRTDSVYYD
jgi:hypothetical protein